MTSTTKPKSVTAAEAARARQRWEQAMQTATDAAEAEEAMIAQSMQAFNEALKASSAAMAEAHMKAAALRAEAAQIERDAAVEFSQTVERLTEARQQALEKLDRRALDDEVSQARDRLAEASGTVTPLRTPPPDTRVNAPAAVN